MPLNLQQIDKKKAGRVKTETVHTTIPQIHIVYAYMGHVIIMVCEWEK